MSGKAEHLKGKAKRDEELFQAGSEHALHTRDMWMEQAWLGSKGGTLVGVIQIDVHEDQCGCCSLV